MKHTGIVPIVLLSGPVASGKSTLARTLQARLGAAVIGTRKMLSRNLRRSGDFSRQSLQSEGERLDRMTGGAWLRDELEFVLSERTHETMVVVDAVRTRNQIHSIRERHGRRVAHVHLTATEALLSERYIGRGILDGGPEFTNYDEVRQSCTERAVNSLLPVANLVVDTASNDEESTFVIVRNFLRLRM